MTQCAQCRKQLPDAAAFCPACGTATEASSAGGDAPAAGDDAPEGDEHENVTETVTRIRGGAKGRAPAESIAGEQGAGNLETSTIEIGTIIKGRYRILDRLGSGNMGSVYRAQDLSLGQDVALKFITPQCSADESCASLLMREVRLARMVTHPNVCRVHDIDSHDGVQFISMEYVDGEDLKSLLHRIGRVPRKKAHEITRQLCAGLQAAHERGVLHCDLKPSNVMLDGEGNVRIADFGIAAAVGAAKDETIRGSPAYMAPELFTGASTSVATDLFSLGLVLYEIYTGKRLFDADSMTDLLEKHRSAYPRIRQLVEDLDPGVDAVIGHLLERDPAGRPSSAMAVLAQIPGGDPLAAALASGETPSPELIAEAGGASVIRKRSALMLIACMIAGWLLLCWLGDDVKLINRSNLHRSGQVLAQTAIDLQTELFGARSVAGATGWRFERNDGFALHFVNEPEPKYADWSRRLTAPWPNLVDFFYRSSPSAMRTVNVKGRVQWNDPAFVVPGMVRMRLSPTGKLVELAAIPPTTGTFASPGKASTESNAVWDRLFRAAGLDRQLFRPVGDAVRLVPFAAASSTAAWLGTYPGTEHAIRVEAAERDGSPVQFVLTENRAPPSLTDRYPPTRTWRDYAMVLLMLVATAMAWVHVARGRSDRRGAARIGLATVSLVVGFTVLTGDHNGRLAGFFELVNQGMAHGLLVSGQLIVFYLALEPRVRRTWPETMISWSRLLAGRFRDSLVGYHVLLGVVLGVWLAVLVISRYHVARLAGQPEGQPLMLDSAGLEAIVGPVSAIGTVMEITVDQTRNAMKLLLGLVMIRWLVKSKTMAGVIAVAITAATFSLSPGGIGGFWYALGVIGAAITAGMLTLQLMRLGVLSVMISLVVCDILLNSPLSLDPDDWYASDTALSFLVIGALSLHAFRCATRFSREDPSA